MKGELHLGEGKALVQLLEAEVGGLLTEAATADVQAVLADQTMRGVAHTAGARARAELLGVSVPGSLNHVGQSPKDAATEIERLHGAYTFIFMVCFANTRIQIAAQRIINLPCHPINTSGPRFPSFPGR